MTVATVIAVIVLAGVATAAIFTKVPSEEVEEKCHLR